MLQVIANGIVTGSSIALMALVFQLVFLPIRVFHVALGAVFTGVPYGAWLALQGGLPTWAVITVRGGQVVSSHRTIVAVPKAGDGFYRDFLEITK